MTRSIMAEIKVVFLGNMNAGKTTVVNALLRDKFGEAAMKRTTAGVYQFCLNKVDPSDKTSALYDNDNESGPELIHEVVKAHNAIHRQRVNGDDSTGPSVAAEKSYEVFLCESLCEMREGVQLVLVDVAGLNEAGSSTMYKTYVMDNWETFDCVIAVLDATKEADTGEQMDLLELIKSNLDKKKKLPVVFLCNKADDPDDAQTAALVDEHRKVIQKSFKIEGSAEAVEWVLGESKGKYDQSVFPLFIPVSALYAFIFQKASLLDYDQFKSFDEELIDKLGKAHRGPWAWKKLDGESRYKEAYEAIRDPEFCRAGLEASNWETFLEVVKYCVGGYERQTSLIEKQFEVATEAVSAQSIFARQLQVIYETGQFLGKSTDHVKTLFWENYRQCRDDALEAFELPSDVYRLALPMKQLVSYYDFVRETRWKSEDTAVIDEMKTLFRRQWEVIFQHEEDWRRENNGVGQPWNGDSKATTPATWNELTSFDWASIFGSVLLVSPDRYFYESFGVEKMKLERQADHHKQCLYHCTNNNVCPNHPNQKLGSSNYCGKCAQYYQYPGELSWKCPCSYCAGARLGSNGYCSSCKYTYKSNKSNCIIKPGVSLKYENGSLAAEHADMWKAVSNIEFPESLSNPKHFGHTAWLFCRFMEKLDKSHTAVS